MQKVNLLRVRVCHKFFTILLVVKSVGIVRKKILKWCDLKLHKMTEHIQWELAQSGNVELGVLLT